MSRSRRPTPSSRPFRSIQSQMTLDDHVAVEESAAAELRGDWATAFERHRSIPMYAASQQGARLRLMAELGDEAPGWLVSRFLTVMAHRWEFYGQPRRSGRVLQHVVPVLYPHGIPFAAMGCDHVEQVGAWIFGRDWVVRQADVYDLGGLRELLHLPAAIGAVGLGEHVEEWCQAPMGGYRVAGADGDVLLVADAATGAEIELLDLGLTVEHEVGTHVLGRLVPAQAAPGRLFDWRPLPIDERTARAVARHPERWLKILAARASSRALPEAYSHLSDCSVSADLPSHSWGALLGHPVGDLPRPPRTLVAEALKTALRLAAADDPRTRHLISELLLDEALDERTLARFATAKYRSAWEVLAGVLPGPAARRCGQALWMLDAASTEDGLAG